MAPPKRVVPSKSKGGYSLFEWVAQKDETNLCRAIGEIDDYAIILRQYSVFEYAHGVCGRYSR